MLRERVDSGGDAPFAIFEEGSLSFGELDERSGRAANLLRELGVRRGDTVCLMVSNRPEFLELWFGLAKLGAVMVPLDASLRGRMLAYVVSHSDAAVLAADECAFSAAGDAAFDAGSFGKRLWIGGAHAAPRGFLSYDRAIAGLPATVPGAPEPGPSDVMSIVYTPGTTSLPKGVVMSHLNYCATGGAWARDVVRANSDDVLFTALPLTRVHTQTLAVMSFLAGGCPLALRKTFDATAFLDDVRRFGGTVVGLSGAMLASLMALPLRPDDASNPARLALVGGGAGKDRRNVEARFGVKVVEWFGLTECGGPGLVNAGGNAKEGSIGKPLPSYEVKVVDEYDEELPTGISGEIVLRSRIPGAMFLGYHKESDRTAEAMRNGWLHTGDRGYVDEEGDFFFMDRMKDCIRHRGEIVSSTDIEEVVNAHPKVRESAAVGVLSELDEEDVKVFVVPRPGAELVPEEIVDWCAARMSGHGVPRYVELVPGLPKNADAGKRKHEIRRIPAGGGGARDKART